MAERKSQLDALAFDIQFFISEHAQDLPPQQNRQMLRLLNELQRSFQDHVERTTAQVDALQGRLQQMEQAARLKVRLNQKLGSVGLWDVLYLWVFWPESIYHDSRSLRLPVFDWFRPVWFWSRRQLFWPFFLLCFWFYVCVCERENTCVYVCMHVQAFSF